jgi:hypothetical protein
MTITDTARSAPAGTTTDDGRDEAPATAPPSRSHSGAAPAGTPIGHRAGVVAAFGVTTALSVATAIDPDLWWHLRTGEIIVDQGIPSVDTLSFTVAGTPWVTHEWATQVGMWGLWSLGGSTALILAFGAIVVAAYAMAFATSRARPMTTAAVMVLAAATSMIATAPRPQMLNLFCLALIILALERMRDGRLDARWIWAMPVLTTVWANLHSGYLTGVVVLGVYAVCERLEVRRTGGRAMPAAIIGRLPAVTVVAFVAAAANPSGWHLWVYPFETLQSDAMRRYIVEWHSPDFHSPWFWPFVLLLALTAVSMVASRRSPGWTPQMLVLGSALAGMQSMRHIPLFAIIAIPVVADQVDAALARRRNGPPVAGRLARSAPIAVLVAGSGVIIATMFVSSVISVNDEAVAESYPEAAVDVLVASGLDTEPGFNAYQWGGYLIWRDLPVYIDGRADVYGDEFMEWYFRAEDVEDGWREPLDEPRVQWALLAPDAELGVMLDEVDDWTSIYDDGVAELFYRCDGSTVACPELVTPRD